jgi:uncharacterized tellurite resistance protein B-like protein
MIGRMYAAVAASIPLPRVVFTPDLPPVYPRTSTFGALTALSALGRTGGMHIIGIVAAILGLVAVWYWRIKVLHEAGQEAADAVGRVRGAYRMRKFKKQAEGSVLNAIDDPAMAAAVFLFALAAEDAVSAHKAPEAIKSHAADMVAPERLDELVAYAAWAARDIVDSRDVVRRFKPLWRERLTLSERQDLIRMAEEVAALSPAALEAQRLSLDALREAIAT